MSDRVKAILKPKSKNLGDGFTVRRALPFINHRSVGPWVFFDHFGPVNYKPGQGMDVRPHPHINLATVTYLFEGEIFHRDSLGNALPILPGAVNLMVAGKGIVHSERTRPELKAKGFDLHGLQLWHALPEEFEEVEPEFHHYPAADIPEVEVSGVKIRLIMGEAYGASSPVKTFAPTLYMEARIPAEGILELSDEAEEIAIYPMSDGVSADGLDIERHEFAIVSSGTKITASRDALVAVIGGKTLGHRFMDWNFISSRKERLDQAKEDWRAGRFPTVPGDEDEFIPLP